MAKNAQSESPFKTLTKTQVNVYFQDHPPKVAWKWTTFGLLSRPQAHKVSKWHGFFQDHGGWVPKVDFIQDHWKKESKDSTPRYMVPVNEVSWVIWDPQKAKMAQPVKDQPLSCPPPKGIEIQPHLRGAWIHIHWQYLGSSSVVP